MNEARYLRTPIATAHYVDWWHLGGVQLLRRMDPQARHEWERLAKRVVIPAKHAIEPPKLRGVVVAVLESGRIRMALPIPEREPEPVPVLLPHLAEKQKAAKPPEPKPPEPPLVVVAEAGDMFGVLPGGSKKRYGPQYDTLVVEALRDSTIWFTTEDALRGFLWKRGHWKLPTTRSVRWRNEDTSRTRPLSLRWIKRQASIALTALDSRLPRDGVPIEGLRSRTRNARAAWAMIQLLRRDHDTYGPEQRIPKRFSTAKFAAWIGADVDWTKSWLHYAKSEDVLRRSRGHWVVVQQWRLHQWADATMMEQTFTLPPDPYDDMVEPDEAIGRPSRTAEGTTPEPEPTPGAIGQAY